MTSIKWDKKARKFLRKLPNEISSRIFEKTKEVKKDVRRYLETLVGRDFYKIRIGNYRLFVDYYPEEDLLYVRAIRHRKNAYKGK
ncbi:MAG: type II toxin-antitoxin system RelE/ParE family toxin [Candidatus Pacearchaeota archaeon]